MMFRRGAMIASALVLLLPLPAHADEVRLLVTMQVDRLVVTPGGSISYAVRVDNVGDADAAHVRVTSHLPEHTTAVSENCPDGTVEPDGDICLQPQVPTPGAGDGTHQVVHSRSPLAAGDGFTLRFRVRVDEDAPLGTVLPNHAHAATPGGDDVTSARVETLVVAATPEAFVGGEAIDVGGRASTDSFDAAAGTFAETREASGGNLASNGDITVRGASVVNGDATPGPGHTVTIEGEAVVTGATAPADAAFVLHPVEAGRYREANANERLCADAAACTDASFDPATAALRVRGSAVVPPGAYYLCSLEVNGRLVIESPVTFWIGAPRVCGDGGGVRFASGGVVDVDTGRPGEFRVRLDGDSSAPGRFELTAGARFTGSVYGPAGEGVVDGGSELFGGLVAGSLATGEGGSLLHRDRSLHG